MFWAFCNQHCGGLHKQLCPQVHLYLRIWKHGMVFNLLSTRRYLKQKLRAKVVHFLDTFSKYTGQVFHRTNSSRCKACEKRTFLFQFADVHGQQSAHFCVQGSTGGGQKVEPEDESCQSGRKKGPPCCARTKWQTQEPQKSNIWSSWCGVLRKRLFLLYSVQCTLQRGHLLAKRFALKVIGMRMLISRCSINN